jgi:hypothetical protein
MVMTIAHTMWFGTGTPPAGADIGGGWIGGGVLIGVSSVMV